MDYNIGDIIEVHGRQDSADFSAGFEGRVITVQGDIIGVEFDEKFSAGHSCSCCGADGHCYFINASKANEHIHIEKIDKEEILLDKNDLNQFLAK